MDPPQKTARFRGSGFVFQSQSAAAGCHDLLSALVLRGLLHVAQPSWKNVT